MILASDHPVFIILMSFINVLDHMFYSTLTNLFPDYKHAIVSKACTKCTQFRYNNNVILSHILFIAEQ